MAQQKEPYRVVLTFCMALSECNEAFSQKIGESYRPDC